MKKVLIAFTIFVVVLLSNISVFAEDNPFIVLNNENRTASRINCFDVYENEFIAVGFENGYINTYNMDGTYLSTINVGTSGYLFEYNPEGIIVIYKFRSNEIITITNEKYIQVEKFDFTEMKEKFSYINEKVKSIGNKRFEMIQSFFDDKIIVSDIYGTRIIYETNTDQRIGRVFKVILLISFLIIAVFSISKNAIQLKLKK